MELNSYTFMHRSRRLPNASVALMLVSCRNCGCNRSITKHFYPDTTSDFTVVLKKATLMSHSHTFDKQRLDQSRMRIEVCGYVFNISNWTKYYENY